MARIGLDLRFWRAGTGGIGRYSRNLLTELLKLDQATAYTAIITPEDESEFHLQAPNLQKLVVPIPHFSLAEQRRLPRILNTHHFDLVHFANFNHPLLYRRPFVVTIHDMIMHLFPGAVRQQSFLHRAAYHLDFNDCRRAKRIIVPSQSTKNDLVGKLDFPAAKIAVTPEGAANNFRLHTETEKQAIKQKLGLPKRFLLFVSRWEPYKGLPELLTAYDILKETEPDLGLVVCGRPEASAPAVEATIRDRQQTDRRLVTPGFVAEADLPAIYAAASVFVHPSWYEGFGLMILEALASGVPVVTSNVSSLPEVVGDAGLLVKPHDPAAIAAACQRILKNPQLADDLAAKGLVRVKQYSWHNMAAQTLTVYREALG